MQVMADAEYVCFAITGECLRQLHANGSRIVTGSKQLVQSITGMFARGGFYYEHGAGDRP
jgi:hypothetical protein